MAEKEVRCPNCDSIDVADRYNIRGTANIKVNKKSDLNSINVVDFSREGYQFTECAECDHRWKRDVK